MNWVDKLKLMSWDKDYQTLASLLEYNPTAKLLDLACSDGKRTARWVENVGTHDVTGVDIKDWDVPFKFVKTNLDEGLPFEDETFDVVIAQDIIEHVRDTDLFVSEIYRVLKSGGYTVIGTPNLSSGKVIIELILNKQPHCCFVSDYFEPRNDSLGINEWKKSKGYLHRRLFTAEGLKQLLTYHGFKIEKVKRTGYGAFLFGVVLKGLYAASLRVKAIKE